MCRYLDGGYCLLVRRKISKCRRDAVRLGKFRAAYPEEAGWLSPCGLGGHERRFVLFRDRDRPPRELPFDMAEDVTRGREWGDGEDTESLALKVRANGTL